MRTVRLSIPGVTYHLISRFVDRQWFFRDEEERGHYLRLLGRALGDCDWRCLAYALMSSHIHLAMVAGCATLQSWIKRVHSPFADWMNIRHGRIGPMFVRGPKDYAVPPGKTAALIAYIHNNPVRAGVVSDPAESTWTSHAAYVGRTSAPTWLDVTSGLESLGAPAFDAWVASSPDDPTKLGGHNGRMLRTLGRIEPATPTMGAPVMTPLVTRPETHVRPDARWFVQLAAEVVGISSAEACSRRRSSNVIAAREIAVHAAAAFGVTGAAIAAALGLSQSGVTQIGRRSLDPELSEARDCVIARVRTVTGATDK